MVRNPPKKIFIRNNNNYIEISADEHNRRKLTDPVYREKNFVLIQGCLLETSQRQRQEINREKNRAQYLKRLDAQAGLLSIDEMYNEISAGNACISLVSDDVADVVEHKLLITSLYSALMQLSDDERLLIYRHYYDNISEKELASVYGITQQAISKRICTIRRKLRKIMRL